ncbi:hypothetical protein [Novosphingobium sp. KACC 22771]|uniref:hypothetical protein n=1 Tax=Novosphingobium sp. KACC 22771 TaxID=3025670 RepID=UPI002365BB67|nr:hypothetical protein [Novosphingobium sp. KACC 22771]WDF73076.1 hypothetical protein PQ467_03275 [Novosphingobium sp. KACC 22771]
MSFNDEPVAQGHIISAFSRFMNVEESDIFVPIMSAKSFLSNRANLIGSIDNTLDNADLSSGPGLIDSLKIIGGVIGVAEGLSIFANASRIGVVVVEVFGLGTVSAGLAAVIGLGAAVLGAYFLYKGIQALWPHIRRRLERDLGSEAMSFFS